MVSQRKIRALLVDDKQSVHLQVLETFPESEIDFKVATNTTTALAMFREGAYDVALVDLDLQEDNGPNLAGIPLGYRLKSKDKSLVLVLYSGSIEEGAEHSFGKYNDCIDAGASYVKSLFWLTSSTPTTVVKTLRQWIDEYLKDDLSYPEIVFERSLRTMSYVERIGGKEQIRRMLRQVLPDAVSCKLEGMPSGYGGAILLSACSDLRNGQKSSHVLKLSQSYQSLSDELSRRPYSGTSVAFHSVPLERIISREVDDWSIAVMPLIPNATTLRDYLLSRPSRSDVVAIARSVISDLLVTPASMTVNVDQPPESVAFTSTFFFEAVDCLERTRLYASLQTKSYLPRIEKAIAFIDSLAAGDNSVYFGKAVARLHGDLHSRNIVLGDGNRPFLIDFARGDPFPRTLDFAALDVDIILSVMDSHDGKDWQYRKIESWYEAVENSYPLTTKVESAKREAPLVFRSMMLDAIQTELNSVTEFEYMSSLLFQLLRYLRFSSVSLPRKVLLALWLSELAEKSQAVRL